MADEEQDKNKDNFKDGSMSISSQDFNPIANSTMMDINTSTPQRQKPESTKDQPEKGSSPAPSSICFADPPDNEETTRPIGPMQNCDKIVSETQDLISNLFQLMLNQRRFLLVCAYQISSLHSIVQDHYNPLLKKMDTFLTYSNSFQTEWFFQYYRLLPVYADYALVLKDIPSKVMVDEIPNSVKESTLKYLANDVINNMFAGGLQVKVQRSMNADISLRMDYLRQAFGTEDLPLKLWLDLFEAQSENAKKVEGHCFELLSIADLLGVDENLKPKTKYLRFDEKITV